jgi:UDP-glucose 6-dehydrogenase
MQDLNRIKGHLVVVKSTVPAYKLKEIIEQCIDLKIVLNPEFLTEKNYIEDFRNPPMLLLGGDRTTQIEWNRSTKITPCADLVRYSTQTL